MANPYRKSTKLPEGSTKRFPIVPRLIATSFGAGFLPVCPGTWGALVAIILWLPLYLWASAALTLCLTLAAVIFFTIAGTWASNVAERYWGHDPVVACADETVGQWITLLPIAPFCPWWQIVLALALFRFSTFSNPSVSGALKSCPADGA